MTSKSSIRTCTCCKKSGNNCKKMTNVTSEMAISDLGICFPSANVISGVDVCTGCIAIARWKRIKSDKANNNAPILNMMNNENSVKSKLDSLDIGI